MRYLLAIIYTIATLNAYAQKEEESTKRFKTDIQYLASDQLEGRLTGSTGESRSSLYIADEFKKFKLSPLGDSGSYLQNFSVIRLRISQSKAPLLWQDKAFKIVGLLPKDGEFYPISQSINRDSLDKVGVFQAGYGIQAADVNHDDYRDTTGIRGKVFAIRLGSPESNNAHSRFEPYEGINYKVDLAIKMGARGVVFYRLDTLTEAPKGKLDRNVKPRSIPVVYVSTMQHSLMIATEISFQVNIIQLNATAHNVIGFINNKKKKTIIIGAHQDHLGYNEFGGSRDTRGGQIHNGADDNASGVAMMLELMRKIKKSKKLRKNNYIFIAFSGEEQGLIGSNYFVNHPVVDIKTIKYMLNFDMVGRLDSNKKVLMVYGVGTTPEWKNSISKLKTDSTQIKVRTTESGTGSSDHTNFYYQNIPVLHFFTGQHYDYHMPSDDEEKINYHGMYLCYDVILQMITSVNKKKEMPFTATKSEESTKMSFKVTLGIMPDYIFDGTGLRVDGVNIGKPGEKAGLLKGDIILQLGEYRISNIQDYMKALGGMKKGDTVKMKILRGTEEKELSVTF
jgi:aminopeptidase YwaD